MVGEGLRVAGQQPLIATAGVLAERLSLGIGRVEQAGELALGLGVLAGWGQAAQPGDRGRAVAEGGLDRGEVGRGLGVLREAGEHGAIVGARSFELAAALGEEAALEVEPGEREGRGVAIGPGGAFEGLSRARGVAGSGQRAAQGAESGDVGLERGGGLAQRDRLRELAARLQDRGAETEQRERRSAG